MRHDHYTLKPEYKHIGPWSWNDEILWSKIETSFDTEQCWEYTGASSPTGGLFGARKNGVPQMTQARRLVFMSQTGQDVTPYQVTLKCANQMCCNPNHFELKTNNRLKNKFGDPV